MNGEPAAESLRLPRGLYDLFARSAERWPDRVAVEEVGGGSLTYRELWTLTDRLARWLAASGVSQGDRVGIYLHKSIDSVASIFAILQCGAAYVPIDPLAPVSRGAYILSNCQVKAVIVERLFADPLQSELEQRACRPRMLTLTGVGGGVALQAALDGQSDTLSDVPATRLAPEDLAYLLYTSGSTGMPKGVMLSQENGLCFVDWCSSIFQPTEQDRFSSHAPFHFDLSILDIYVPIKHGAALVLFGENLGKEPLGLAQAIAERRISHWYSAPSILSMLVQQGRLAQHDYSALRMVLFAGEVFPVKYLRELKTHWPAPRYFNLFGPTETNVCTWHELPSEIPADRTEPYPIGRVCSHYQGRVVDTAGTIVSPGAEGELWISGPGVMRGYWNLPEQNERVFVFDADGTRWYRTGDMVAADPEGDYRFLGRRDRMIKRRGYRVELGEIEAALYRHPAVAEAAVVARATDAATEVHAFLSTKDGEKLSIIALKKFCTEQLPLYMVPDTFHFLTQLPKTSTDKVDYQALPQ